MEGQLVLDYSYEYVEEFERIILKNYRESESFHVEDLIGVIPDELKSEVAEIFNSPRFRVITPNLKLGKDADDKWSYVDARPVKFAIVSEIMPYLPYKPDEMINFENADFIREIYYADFAATKESLKSQQMLNEDGCYQDKNGKNIKFEYPEIPDEIEKYIHILVHKKLGSRGICRQETIGYILDCIFLALEKNKLWCRPTR